MTITWTIFAVRLLVGFFLAVGIGIERQWLKTRAVLKTNVLVTLGSAMFVMLSIMTPGETSPTRISAQIVSGVGFLGGGVILREGASVRGINTAATLWCAAAIGTLVGSGYLAQAYVSTLAVVGANLLLRPLVKAFQQQDDEDDRSPPDNSELVNNSIRPNLAKRQSSISSATSSSVTVLDRYYQYSCHVLCFPKFEEKVLGIIFGFARERNLTISGVESNNIDRQTEPELLLVEIKTSFSHDFQIPWEDLEEIIRLLKTEAQVSSVNWQLR